MHDGSGSDRGLATSAGALIGPGLGLQPPCLATTASRADKPVRPARRCKVFGAGGLIAKALLELDQGAGKVGHQGSRKQLCSRFVLIRTCSLGYNILCSRTQRDTASLRNVCETEMQYNAYIKKADVEGPGGLVLALPVDFLEISVRVQNALKYAEILFIGELIERS